MLVSALIQDTAAKTCITAGGRETLRSLTQKLSQWAYFLLSCPVLSISFWSHRHHEACHRCLFSSACRLRWFETTGTDLICIASADRELGPNNQCEVRRNHGIHASA